MKTVGVAARLCDSHRKDATEAAAKGKGTAVGKGVIDIPGVLKTRVGIRFASPVALEYEASADDPMPGILESFASLHPVPAPVG